MLGSGAAVLLLRAMSRLPQCLASPAAVSLALAAGALSKISAGIQALDLDAVSTPVSSQGHAGSKHPANVSPGNSSVLGSGDQVGDCQLTQPCIGTSCHCDSWASCRQAHTRASHPLVGQLHCSHHRQQQWAQNAECCQRQHLGHCSYKLLLLADQSVCHACAGS